MAKKLSTQAFEEMIKLGVSPLFKSAGFRKIRYNYYHRKAGVLQIANFQASTSSFWDKKIFYINVDIVFDDICTHFGCEVKTKPPKPNCYYATGIVRRIESMVEGCPSKFELLHDDDLPAFNSTLIPYVEKLVADLAMVNDLASFRQHRWFDHLYFDNKPLFYYLLGDIDACNVEIDHLVKRFKGRRILEDKKHWIEKMKLDI